MKILYVFLRGRSSALPVYGTERRFVEVTKAYEKLGSSVYSIERYPSQRVGSPEHSSLIRFEPNTGKTLPRSLMFTLFAFVKGLQSARKFGVADTIVSGERSLSNVLPSFLLSVVSRRPFAVVLHHAKEESAHPGRGGMAALTQSLQYAARRLIIRRANLLIAVSSATRDEFAKAFQLDHDRFVVTGNGTRGSPFSEAGFQRECDALYVGRFYESKGIHLLPLIWKKVVDSFPNAKMVAVGGYGSQVEKFEDEVNAMGLGANLQVRGYVTEAELERLFMSSKVFVLPSQMEGFSLATAEAMACGCACVVSDLPALRSVFGGSLVYAPANDEDAFANAILTLLLDEEKRRVLSQAGVLFSKKFSWDSVAAQEISALQRIVKRGQPV